ncbi:MAG TPA: alkaline phosphatase family protein [Lacipirellula sp.]
MASRKHSVLIVGLDGATFDLMLPWIEQGRLPHLGRVLRSGARSRLESTIPPITPCAWSSFMTGKNPGKHGLFDFIEPDGHQGFRFTNASFREGDTIWGLLSRHGRRVGVVNVPMTYPPEPVNGFLISGLDTPHEHSQYMYPVEIRQELREAGIRYRIDQQHLGNMRTNARRRAQLDSIFEAETARTATLQHLSEGRNCDFRMIVYGATDQVQHHFWHFMDETHDKFDAEGANEFRHAIRDTYMHCDEQLGLLLDECDDDTIVIVMSDHGFGPMTNVRLRMNQILRDAGLLTFDEAAAPGKLKQAVAGWLDRLLRSTLSSDMKRTIAGLLPKLRVWFENLDEAKIDWTKTSAYVNEAYRSSPAIWLNRLQELSDADVHELRDRIEMLMLSLVDPKTGGLVVSNCYRPQNIYHGPHTAKAPDLLPSWWEDGFLLDQSEAGPNAPPAVERSTAPLEGGVEFAASHRLDGVLMMSGGPLRKEFAFEGARIIDVAPTVLYLMGLPVPDDMDGRVLVEAIEEEFVETNPIEFEAAEVDAEADADEAKQSFTQDESELIAKRLQALGYIK